MFQDENRAVVNEAVCIHNGFTLTHNTKFKSLFQESKGLRREQSIGLAEMSVKNRGIKFISHFRCGLCGNGFVDKTG